MTSPAQPDAPTASDRLDPEEREILEALERGALRRAADADEQIAAAVAMAHRTLSRTERVRSKP